MKLLLLLLPTYVNALFRFFRAPLEEDNVDVIEVAGDRPWFLFWHDSYSVGDRCYCFSSFDHNIGDFIVNNTPLGEGATIKEICDFLGPGPGSWGRPRYNDIQCGNGPPNNDSKLDEITCPGRVEYGQKGCGYIGPKWNFEAEDSSASSNGFLAFFIRMPDFLYSSIVGIFT